MKTIATTTLIATLAIRLSCQAGEVSIEYVSATATSVFVAGTFNAWNAGAKPLARPNGGDRWTGYLDLPPGEYAYKFVVDGEWKLDPSNPATTMVNGIENSLLKVSGGAELGKERAPETQDVRVWTSRSGKELTARFHAEEGDAVLLKPVTGSVVRIPLTGLSDADQVFVATLRGMPTAGLASAMAIRGVSITPGVKTLFRAPLDKKQVRQVKAENNPAIAESIVALAVPQGFRPAATNRLVIVSQTSDGDASSVNHMDEYIETALSKGWVIMAADPPEKARDDSTLWRWTLIEAGLNALRETWPASHSWPVVFAGFSGGAKRSSLLAGLATKEELPVSGVFLGGCNQDFLTLAIRNYNPSGLKFKRVPVFISNGEQDTTSTLQDMEKVCAKIKASGFRYVRTGTYTGGHSLYREHFGQALEWFALKGGDTDDKPVRGALQKRGVDEERQK